jgi:hypothetical protein
MHVTNPKIQILFLSELFWRECKNALILIQKWSTHFGDTPNRLESLLGKVNLLNSKMLQLLLSILCIVQYVICRYSLAANGSSSKNSL